LAVTGKNIPFVQRKDALELEKVLYSYINDGCYLYKPQSTVQELGVRTHSYEDFVREVVVPYMQSGQ
jgi:hypothetical protein